MKLEIADRLAQRGPLCGLTRSCPLRCLRHLLPRLLAHPALQLANAALRKATPSLRLYTGWVKKGVEPRLHPVFWRSSRFVNSTFAISEGAFRVPPVGSSRLPPPSLMGNHFSHAPVHSALVTNCHYYSSRHYKAKAACVFRHPSVHVGGSGSDGRRPSTLGASLLHRHHSASLLPRTRQRPRLPGQATRQRPLVL